jgi:hypothetical protein
MDISDEFLAGYLDGRDLDAPWPSANRSACYRHSFEVGRAEKLGKPIPAAISRVRAAIAEANDASLTTTPSHTGGE